jgi:Cu-Zn family superoxide dismutase
MSRLLQCLALTAVLVTIIACTLDRTPESADAHEADAFKGVKEAVAVMSPTEGNNARGVLRFTETNGKIKIVAEIEGLSKNQMHAMHIHQWGDITGKNGKATGGHYNPKSHDHGLPGKPHRHAGDLGNLQADANGKARYELTVENISIAGSKNPIVGRGVIIHAKKDDGGQPTGNAGPRIAQGVIGIRKPAD